MATGKTVGLAVLTAAVAAGGAWYVLRETASTAPKGVVAQSPQNVAPKGERPKVRRPDRKKMRPVSVEVVKPTFDLPGIKEDELTVAQRELIDEIRKALREENPKKLSRLVRKLQAQEEWPDGIPAEVKRAALKAIGYYAESCLPEIVGFLGDADSSIVSEAVDYWEDAIAELDGDRVIAEQVVLAGKVVTNPDSIESILSEINESTMRPSVAVEAFKEILASGTDAAKDRILQQVHDYTNDESITTVEELDAWLAEHPDESDAEEMYGPMDAEDDANDD